jgi:ArsR family transcriptional regulator
MTSAVIALKALAQDRRLAIYRLLVQAGAEGMSVGEIGERQKLAAATLTNHLHVLRRAGLVRDRREGRSIRCRADYARMNALLAFLTENCCGQDTSRALGCAPPRERNRTARRASCRTGTRKRTIARDVEPSHIPAGQLRLPRLWNRDE